MGRGDVPHTLTPVSELVLKISPDFSSEGAKCAEEEEEEDTGSLSTSLSPVCSQLLPALHVHPLEVGSTPCLVLSVGRICSAQLPRDFISFRRKRDTPAPNAYLVDADVPLDTRQAAYDDGEVSGGGRRDDAAIRGSENTQSSFLALVL
jgi:hypothetical protein